MEESFLLDIISSGETTTVQFKENITNAASIAQEMVAFSNTKGGKIIVGVNDKTGEITGLSFTDLQRINSLLATAANEHVKSAIIIVTETVSVQEKKVLIATISEGTDKPYMDKDGLIFVKNGSDKRKVTSKEELSRLLQSSGNMYAEERLIPHSSYKDLDFDRFQAYYEKKFNESCEKEKTANYILNFRLGKEDKLNVAGALLFGKNMQRLLPQFFISAVWFAGNELTDTVYRSSENIVGTLPELYKRGYEFIWTKINYVQGDKSFNSLGEPEIPLIVFSELLINALIHRDYFINDSIKIFMFQNRIEIKSPGKLPNSLTINEIKSGLRKSRNFILATIAAEQVDYRGIGSGIVRALAHYPHIEFMNDTEGEQFTAIIYRKNT